MCIFAQTCEEFDSVKTSSSGLRTMIFSARFWGDVNVEIIWNYHQILWSKIMFKRTVFIHVWPGFGFFVWWNKSWKRCRLNHQPANQPTITITESQLKEADPKPIPDHSCWSTDLRIEIASWYSWINRFNSRSFDFQMIISINILINWDPSARSQTHTQYIYLKISNASSIIFLIRCVNHHLASEVLNYIAGAIWN